MALERLICDVFRLFVCTLTSDRLLEQRNGSIFLRRFVIQRKKRSGLEHHRVAGLHDWRRRFYRAFAGFGLPADG